MHWKKIAALRSAVDFAVLSLHRDFPRTNLDPTHRNPFMAKIFLGIALAVMLATAALGFLAKSNADKLQTTLKDTKNDLTTTKGTLSLTKTELKKSQDDLTAANTKVAEQEKEIATQKGQMDDLNKKIAEATTAMEAKTTELAAKAKEFEDYKIAKGEKPGEGVPNAAMELLKGEVAKAQSEAAESKALVDSLTAKKKEIEDQMASLVLYKKTREAGIAQRGLTGRILAVNGGWNFVVISVGDKQNSVMGATLLVLRGGEPIAKARVSSVEANTSIADILPGSVRKGVTVQPGDTVVFEGARNATAAAASQPAAGGQPMLPTR